jgi:3-hydroxyacyl-CoA dehydrogenase
MPSIQKVAVIGSGVMGSGIAAQVANAGLEVILLDIVAEGSDRDAVGRDAIQRMRKPIPLH